MWKPIALANAATTVAVFSFIACGVLAYIAPDLLVGIANSWFHALNLEAVRATTPMSLGTFILGVVTFGVYIWVLIFAGVHLYNRLEKWL